MSSSNDSSIYYTDHYSEYNLSERNETKTQLSDDNNNVNKCIKRQRSVSESFNLCVKNNILHNSGTIKMNQYDIKLLFTKK